jgi:hypothetical protein
MAQDVQFPSLNKPSPCAAEFHHKKEKSLRGKIALEFSIEERRPGGMTFFIPQQEINHDDYRRKPNCRHVYGRSEPHPEELGLVPGFGDHPNHRRHLGRRLRL